MKKHKVNQTVKLRKASDSDIQEAIFKIVRKLAGGDISKNDIEVDTAHVSDSDIMATFKVGDVGEGFAEVHRDPSGNKYSLTVKTFLTTADCPLGFPQGKGLGPGLHHDGFQGKGPGRGMGKGQGMGPGRGMGKGRRVRRFILDMDRNDSSAELKMVDTLMSFLKKYKEALTTKPDNSYRDKISPVLYRVVTTLADANKINAGSGIPDDVEQAVSAIKAFCVKAAKQEQSIAVDPSDLSNDAPVQPFAMSGGRYGMTLYCTRKIAKALKKYVDSGDNDIFNAVAVDMGFFSRRLKTSGPAGNGWVSGVDMILKPRR